MIVPFSLTLTFVAFAEPNLTTIASSNSAPVIVTLVAPFFVPVLWGSPPSRPVASGREGEACWSLLHRRSRCP